MYAFSFYLLFFSFWICTNLVYHIKICRVVVSTLQNFVRMYVRALEENCKQLEFKKKRAQKEAEKEKMKLDLSKKESENLIQQPPVKSHDIK